MSRIFVLLALSFALLGEVRAFPKPLREFPIRIVGGVQVSKNELPYQISLQANGRHFCGAAILNANYILTAAHCTTNGSSISSLRAVAGEHSIESSTNDGTEQVRSITRITRHPAYNAETFENDIAILKLASPLSLNSAVAAINLPIAGSTASGLGLVSGWGVTLEDGSLATILRKVSIPIITDAKCREAYGPSSIYDTMLCAGFELGGKDSCQGDSGGPFAVGAGPSRYLAGIVSWGYGCGRPGYPGVYTEVSKFIPFIQTNTQG